MAVERAAYERQLDVLERNQLIEYGALALLGVGLLGFAAFLVDVFPPGVLGLHLTMLGLALYFGGRRANVRATRRRREIRTDKAGVWADGMLVAAREQITDGFFQPRPGRDPNKASSYGSSIRLVDKRRRILFEAEAEEGEALAMLHALGLDPGSKRSEFNGSSPLFSTLGRNLAFVVGVMATTFFIIAFFVSIAVEAPIAPFVILPAILAGMWPSKIAIGVDGVLLRWLWMKKFIPMSKISHIERVEDRTIRVQLVDRSEELLYTSMRRRGGLGGSLASQHRDAILARLGEAIMAYRARGPAADVSALVGKGTRTRGEWLEALGKLRNFEGGYREAVVRDDDLWRVVEDPSAPEDARGGAAMLLRPSLDEAGKARVRVAAEATASPKLRIALDAAAGAHEDHAVQAALEELAGDDAPDARASRRTV